MKKIKLQQKTTNTLYKGIMLLSFITLLLLVMLFSSCNSQSGKRRNTIPSSDVLSDSQFLNKLNSLDTTAVFVDKFEDILHGQKILCVVISQKDSSFIYKGNGRFFQRYYTTKSINTKAKNLK